MGGKPRTRPSPLKEGYDVEVAVFDLILAAMEYADADAVALRSAGDAERRRVAVHALLGKAVRLKQVNRNTTQRLTKTR